MNLFFNYKINVLFTLVFSILSNNIFAQDWQLAKEKDGIKVFTRTSDDSSFKDSKAHVDVNASLEDVLDMLLDVKSHKFWMDRIEVSDVIEQTSDTEFIAYYEVKAPWPVTNRDIVSHYTLKRVAKNKVKFIVNNEPDVIPEKEGFVRIQNAQSIWEIYENEDGRVSIMFYTKSDPGGGIPAWLANTAAEDNPYKTLMGLKEKLEN